MIIDSEEIVTVTFDEAVEILGTGRDYLIELIKWGALKAFLPYWTVIQPGEMGGNHFREKKSWAEIEVDPRKFNDKEYEYDSGIRVVNDTTECNLSEYEDADYHDLVFPKTRVLEVRMALLLTEKHAIKIA